MKKGTLNKLATAMRIPLVLTNYDEVYAHLCLQKPLSKLCLRNGCSFHAPELVQLWNHFNDIWLYKTYTGPGHEVSVGDTVIDVGANIGLFSLYAARAASRVFSFEPDKVAYTYLARNIRESQAENVTCFNQAVGGATSNRLFQMEAISTGSRLCGLADSDTQYGINVQCLSLVEIFDMHGLDRCDFLKLDCEGSEFEILLETPARYLQRIDLISLECHEGIPQRTTSDIVDRLKSNGFSTSVSGMRGNTCILKAKNRRPPKSDAASGKSSM